MTGLSHGLNRLSVSGNRIVDSATGKPVVLRGIVRSGLEYSPRNSGITAQEIEEIVVRWGANIVRVPFNQDWALRRPGYDPDAYLETLDFVVEAAASRGAYTLLDLQWLDAVTPRGFNQDGRPNFVPPLPDLLSIEVWRQLSARYAGEPAVLYDIFNEPHDALGDDPVPLTGIAGDGSVFPLTSRRVSMPEWQPWAAYLVETIRRQNPEALIFVPGVSWAYDLRGFPLPGVQGVVYSTHVYPNKGDNWYESFGALASAHPVFAGEWGGGAGDIEWGEDLVAYLRQRNIGWTAWSWSDAPHLVELPLAPDYRATAFGELVRGALREVDISEK